MDVEVEMEIVAEGLIRARCPALPGCVVLATSHEEALAEVSCAIECYVASLNAAGRPKLVLAENEPKGTRA